MTGMVPPPSSWAVVVATARLVIDTHERGLARLCHGCKGAPVECAELEWAREQLARDEARQEQPA